MRKIKVNAIKGRNLTTGEEFDVGLLGGYENYYTNETVIGTWIDGKKIYRKVIDCGSTVWKNDNNYVFDTAPLNCERVIALKGLCSNGDESERLTLPYLYPSNSFEASIGMQIHGTDVNVMLGSAQRVIGIKNVIVILEYTKVGT